jgi:hypothetical protein
MGLCLADSLLTQNGYNGSNIRIWFWNWWNNGLNNAFRKDVVNRSALFSFSKSISVGLGGMYKYSYLSMYIMYVYMYVCMFVCMYAYMYQLIDIVAMLTSMCLT